MMRLSFRWIGKFLIALPLIFLAGYFGTRVCADPKPKPNESQATGKEPWMDKSLSPDQRAEMVLKELTLDEKIDLVHGQGMLDWPAPPNPKAYLGNGGAGFVLGVPRLGIPMIQMSDAAYGIRASAQNGRYSTALPSGVAGAASWDTHAACEYGALIGRELRAQGYNMTLGGGVNIVRELRNGRNFEYQGEDPILAGTMVGNRIKCEQAQYVIGDIKHYAVNDQENGRNEVNSVIGIRALRESDLLAFQIGVEIGNPGAVMCSYNAVNGVYACENHFLLTDVLRRDWGFKGFVVSDWGGTHSTVKASAAGMDQEQPLADFFGEKLKAAVQSGQVSQAELDEHVRRVLRSEFASGIVDNPVRKSVVDIEGGFDVSRRLAENSIVLLKNEGSLLPLDRNKIHSIAVIGPHADMGMISGGGSAQVDPPGSFPATVEVGGMVSHFAVESGPCAGTWSAVEFNSGENPAAAAELAKKSDVALVFVYQWESEDFDLPNLSLEGNQDALIAQVAAANPHTVVVVESGSAVTMPWAGKVGGILEAWYAGSKGADAVANVLFGDVNPSGKLPITFPRSEADMPHPTMTLPTPNQLGIANVMKSGEAKPTFEVHYDEGLKVGYKWYDAEHKEVLFPFGHGLSYTSFGYSGLKVEGSNPVTLKFSLKNSGARDGMEVAEVYAALPADAKEPPKRLVGWSKVLLKAGETREMEISIDPRYLSIYDEATNSWKLVPGAYTFFVGGSSQNFPVKEEIHLK